MKRWMPRGLYGRAALILVLPVAVLTALVSVVFVQRHFEDVTRQLTRGVALELARVVALAPEPERAAGLAAALEIDLAPAPLPPPARDRRRAWDISGIWVIATLRARLPELVAVDLAESHRDVRVWLDSPSGPLMAEIDRRRAAPSNPHQFLVIVMLFAAMMTGVAYVYLRNQLRPVTRLAAAAEAFGKGRVVPYRPSGAQEVRAAGQAFLDMRARIERQIEQRTVMLSGVSHDLRTPLTRLRLGLSILPDGPEVAEMARDLDDMERMIDAFLDFARAEARDDPAPAVPADLARRVAARMAGAELGALQGGAAPVPLRRLAVERALDNLLGNALRYGTRARLSLRAGPGVVTFTVEDDGPGIPPARREDAQRPFVRLDAARNQDRGPGLGLGLAIARDVARSHGGALRLSDSAELGGLRVDLDLAV